MAFKHSYSKLEIVTALLVCFCMALLFGFLWFFGLIDFRDFRLSLFITVGGTVATVAVTLLAVHFFSGSKHRRR